MDLEQRERQAAVVYNRPPKGTQRKGRVSVTPAFSK